ncbi:hypothetical protein NECAME_01797 [Necator americanus]|uniref:Uncharacterized protein n=1 Tax=Necator americanus TaxID=51031 RepID=W2TN09_NECAM|nr:hypothetical protein NECAME_01797 [Necator americanus]ETN83490.1 hypothetical protein NECAME_01797 [Necator americanus]
MKCYGSFQWERKGEKEKKAKKFSQMYKVYVTTELRYGFLNHVRYVTCNENWLCELVAELFNRHLYDFGSI